jgi:tetratricopeptide (TPR) repeat protein
VPVVQRVGDPALASDHYFRLAIAAQFFGRNEEGRAAAVAAIEHATRAADAERAGRGHYAVAIVDVGTGAIASAIAHAKRATDLLDTPAGRHWCGLSYWLLTWAHMVAGTLAEALAHGERGVAIARETGDRRVEAFAAYITAVVHAARGDAEAAIASAQQATAAAIDPISRGLALFAWAHARFAQGDGHATIAVLRELLGRRPLAVITRARALMLLAEAQRVVRDTAASAETAREALADAEAYGVPMVAGGAQRTLGRIARAAGDLASGENYLIRALETFRRSEATLEMAETRLDLARALVDRNARDEARTHITEAVRVFRASAAPPRVTEAREVARELGLEVTDD